MKILNGHNYSLKKESKHSSTSTIPEFHSLGKKPALKIFNPFVSRNRNCIASEINNISNLINVSDLKGKKTSFQLPPATNYSVHVRAVILKIGDIDTLNEKFYAEGFIEAVWIDPIFKQSSQYSPDRDWNPELYIVNCLGELKQQIWYDQYTIEEYESRNITPKTFEEALKIEEFQIFEKKTDMEWNFQSMNKHDQKVNEGTVIVERRRITGQFWQTLDLKNFPADVQKLTITLSTPKTFGEIELTQSKEKASSVNTSCFADSQEWHLYKRIDVFEFLRDSVFSIEKYPTINFTINAARKPTFYYWNAFFLIFLITMASLSTFSVDCSLNQHRIQTICTLLLTSVSFKWITNRSLPTVSYFTSLDKYSLACMLFLCISMFWHSIIGRMSSNTNFQTSFNQILTLKYYDHFAFLSLCCIFLLINLAYLFWLVKFGYARRRALDKQEKDYTNSVKGQRSTRLKSMLYGI